MLLRMGRGAKASATETPTRSGKRDSARGGRRKRAAKRPGLATDQRRVETAVRMFNELLTAANRAEDRGDAEAAADFERLAWQHAEQADPVRVVHAEELLDVSNQTVRDWVDAGALDDFGGSPKRLGLASVLRAKQIADELREQGRDRDFMSAVLSRLEAMALAQDGEFQESVGQMRRWERQPRPY